MHKYALWAVLILISTLVAAWAPPQVVVALIPPYISYNFVNNGINTGSSFLDTRSSAAYYYNSSGLIVSATNNVPRIDFNSATGKSAGWLVEPATTNIIVQSSDFTNASWTKTGGGITAPALLAPDGSVAQLFTATSGGTVHRASQGAFTVTGSATYTYTGYAHAGTINYVALNVQAASNVWITSVFDVSGTTNSTATQTGTGSTAGTIIATSSTYLGNGWFRLRMTGTMSTTTSETFQMMEASLSTGNTLSATSGSVTFTAAGTETEYWFGPQVELQTYPTSYRFTLSAAATRNVDTVTATSGVASKLTVGPSIWEMTDEATGATTRTAYAAGAFTFPTGKWYRSVAIYPPGTTSSYLNTRLTVNGPY